MGNKFFIGVLMGLPPYGIILKPLGATVQWLGVGIQMAGVVLVVWNLLGTRKMH